MDGLSAVGGLWRDLLTSSDYDDDKLVQRRAGIRKMSAREMYMAHRKYFDDSPGKEGSINNVSIAHDGNIGSGRVFRYRGGTRIPQSPFKIRAGGCPRAELEEKLKFYKWVNIVCSMSTGG
jgi:hypothetical protein